MSLDSVQAALGVIRELIASRSSRYSSSTGGEPNLNATGFRYLLGTCAGVDAGRAEELFNARAQRSDGDTVLTAPGFEALLRDMARAQYDGIGSDAEFIRYCAEYIVPEALQHPVVAAAMQRRAPSPPPPPPPNKPSPSPVADPLGRASALLERLSQRQLPIPGSKNSAADSVVSSPSPSTRASSPQTVGFQQVPPSLPSPVSSVAPLVNQQVRPASPERLTATSVAPTAATSELSLPAFLSSIQLSQLLPTLQDLGCATVADLADVADEEMGAVGIKGVHIRRIRAAFSKHSSGGPSVSSSSSSKEEKAEASVAVPRSSPGVSSSSRHQDEARQQAFDWEEYATADGYIYYHNASTGETTWSRPAADRGTVRTIKQRAADQAKQAFSSSASSSTSTSSKDMTAIMARRVAEAIQASTASAAIALQQTLEAQAVAEADKQPASVSPRAATTGRSRAEQQASQREEAERQRVQERAEQGLSMWPHSKFGVPSAAAPPKPASALARRLGKAPAPLPADHHNQTVASAVDSSPRDAATQRTPLRVTIAAPTKSPGAATGGALPTSARRPRATSKEREAQDKQKVLAQSDAGGAIFHNFHRKEDHLLGKPSSRGRWVRGVDAFKIPELHTPNPAPQVNGPTTAYGVTVAGTAAPADTEISAGFLQPAGIAPTPGQYPYLPPSLLAAAAASDENTNGSGAVNDAATGGELSVALAMSALLAPAVGNEKEKAAFSASYLSSAKRAQSASARVREGAVLAREFRVGLKQAVDAHYNNSTASNSVSSASSVSGASMSIGDGDQDTPVPVASSYAAIHGLGKDGASSDSLGGGSNVGISAADIYPQVYQGLPTMDPRTFDAISRHGLVVNSRRMGYADPRPDIRPARSIMPAAAALYPDHETHHVHYEAKKALDFTTPSTGLQGKSESIWAAQLRPHLHSALDDPKAARNGRDAKRMWSGGGLAPSEAATGYAYRHAAAHSMLTGSGSVYDRLTDVRGYTGTHRHRFDDTGRGLGLAGRDNSYDYALLVSVPTEEQAGLPTAHLQDLKMQAAPGKVLSSRRPDQPGFF